MLRQCQRNDLFVVGPQNLVATVEVKLGEIVDVGFVGRIVSPKKQGLEAPRQLRHRHIEFQLYTTDGRKIIWFDLLSLLLHEPLDADFFGLLDVIGFYAPVLKKRAMSQFWNWFPDQLDDHSKPARLSFWW